MLHLTQNDYLFHLYQAIGTGNKVTALHLINNSVTINFFLNGNTPLHWAIYKNADFDIIKLLLDKGANIYATNHQNYTPLRLAIDYHRIAAAVILIQRGALVGENLSVLLVKPAVQNNPHLINMIIDYGMQYEPTISLQCRLKVIHGDGGLEIIDECIPKILETNLPKNYNANSTHIQLLTPLHVACEDENRKRLRAFLKNRVDHFVVNPEGQIPDIDDKLNTREKIQLLLENNANIEAVNGIGRTPLLEACHHGNDDAVKVLLENHANPHAIDWFGRTALHFSCERKHRTTSSIIQLLLENNANIEAVNWVGLTPLFVACLNGNDEAVKVLLENHANPNVRNRNGGTLLHMLCSWRSETTLQIIQLLLEHNANIEAVDGKGRTPLYELCKSGNIVAVKVLLENHANPNVVDRNGGTLLHMLCSWRSESTFETIQLLLEHNADINVIDRRGWTPLFVACLTRNIVAVNCLLRNHANPNVRDQESKTALHFTCLWEYESTLETIQLLLEYNADIEAVDKEGWTPLLTACKSGNIIAVKFLLENHANPNVVDRNGETPLHIILSSKSETTIQIIQLLLEHNADIKVIDRRGWTPLFVAFSEGNIVAVKCLLENHVNLHTFTYWHGQTALHFTCLWEYESTLETIQLLLEYNVDINAVDEEGDTPLLKACMAGNIVAVKCLLENHANPNIVNRYGETPLHHIWPSESKSTLHIIQLLLEFNVDINAVDKVGDTPLFEACIHGNDKAVSGLLRYGANVNILNNRNQSPLQCAVDKMLSTSFVDPNIYTIIKMLVSQIIKLKAAKLNVNACEFITINGVEHSAIEGLKSNAVLDDTLDTLDIECEEEIERMKMESIGINNMFFYDLLTQHIHLIGILMENEKIQEILKSSIYDEKFPLYIGIIRFRLRDAQIRYRRFKLKKSAREYFSLNISQGLPHECIDEVLDYLTIVDLKKFIRTFEPSRGE